MWSEGLNCHFGLLDACISSIGTAFSIGMGFSPHGAHEPMMCTRPPSWPVLGWSLYYCSNLCAAKAGPGVLDFCGTADVAFLIAGSSLKMRDIQLQAWPLDPRRLSLLCIIHFSVLSVLTPKLHSIPHPAGGTAIKVIRDCQIAIAIES